MTRAWRPALVDARRASVARIERGFVVFGANLLQGMRGNCRRAARTRPSDDGRVGVGSAGFDTWMEDVNRVGRVSRWDTWWATFGLTASVPRLRSRGRARRWSECGGESLGGFVGYSERACAE